MAMGMTIAMRGAKSKAGPVDPGLTLAFHTYILRIRSERGADFVSDGDAGGAGPTDERGLYEAQKILVCRVDTIHWWWCSLEIDGQTENGETDFEDKWGGMCVWAMLSAMALALAMGRATWLYTLCGMEFEDKEDGINIWVTQIHKFCIVSE